MADEAISLCQNALECDRHPGYSSWFVKEMICTQLNVKAAIAAELPEADHGLALFQQIEHRRASIRRPGAEDDEMW
jgi:hypothetical protein